MSQYKTMGEWLDALDDTHQNPVHWTVEINSPVVVRWDGRRGHYDRWGVFREAA